MAFVLDKFSKLSPFLFTAFSFMKDSGKGSDSIYFIGREERVRTGEDTFLGIKNYN